MNPSVIFSELLKSFGINTTIFFATLLIALPLGLIVAFGAMSRFRPLAYLVKVFVWIIRGTPLMLQIIFIYYGPGLLHWGQPWTPMGADGRVVATCVAFAISFSGSQALVTSIESSNRFSPTLIDTGPMR